MRLATGVRLHYAAQGDARGEAIVFLHGWPDSWFSFSRVLPLLSGQYHVLAIDQRGFGDSERPESGYAIADLASDIVAFLDAVGIARTTVVGHSFGSFVARRVAVAYPERVARLVLVGSGITPVNDVTRDVRTAMVDLPDPVPETFAREFQASTAYLPLPGEFFDQIVRESLKLPARLWREVFNRLLEFDDRNQLGRITGAHVPAMGQSGRDFLKGGSGCPPGRHPGSAAQGLHGNRPLSQLGASRRSRRRSQRAHARP